MSYTLLRVHRWEESFLPTRKRPVGVISLAAVIGGTPSPSEFRKVSGGGRSGQEQWQAGQLYCTLLRIISYLPFRAVPALLTATMITIAMPAAIKAYSIEVAAD